MQSTRRAGMALEFRLADHAGGTRRKNAPDDVEYDPLGRSEEDGGTAAVRSRRHRRETRDVSLAGGVQIRGLDSSTSRNLPGV